RLASQISPILEAAALLARLGFGTERPTRANWLHGLENARRGLRSASWWDPARREEVQSLLTRWSDFARNGRKLRDELKARLSPQAFADASAALVYRASAFRSLWARLLPGWWFLKAKLKAWYPQGLPGSNVLFEDLQQLATYHRSVAFCRRVQA